MTMVYRIPENSRYVDTAEYGASGEERRRLPVREFGRSFTSRRSDTEYALDRAREDGERFLKRMAEACPVMYSTDITVEIGPHIDALRRFTLVGWRFSAASPTIEFFQQFKRPEPQPETLWQHAKRIVRSWINRQRGVTE